MKGINVEKSALLCDRGLLIGYNHIFGCFFSAEADTGEVGFLRGYLQDDGRVRFGSPCKNETGIWFPPCMASEIVGIKDGHICQYPIYFSRETPHRFMNAFIAGNKLFLLPGCAGGIVVFDVETHGETVITEWYGEYEQFIPDHLKSAAIYGKSRYGNYLRRDDRIYMPLLHAPVVLELHTVSYETRIHHMECNDRTGFLAIYGSGGRGYLLTRSSNDILEICENEIVNTYHVDMGQDSFGRSIMQDDKIFVLARNTAVLVVFDLITKTQKIMDLSRYFRSGKKTDFGAFINDKGIFWISELHSGTDIRAEACDGAVSVAEPCFEVRETDLRRLIKEKMETDRPLTENRMFSIADMLNIHMNKADKNTERNTGYKLYSQL